MKRTILSGAACPFILKPDSIEQGLTNEILVKFCSAGFIIAGMKQVRFSQAMVKSFYYKNVGESYFEDLEKYMISRDVFAGLLYRNDGENVFTLARKLAGATNPLKADIGTIRRDLFIPKKFGVKNLVHISDSLKSSLRDRKILTL